MKIIWSPLSAERLEEIFDYISKDNLSTAKKFADKIFNKIETLTEHPRRGRKVPEANREEIREVFLGEYRIIYRVEKSKIIILTIRNFKQLLQEEDIK
ncbi:MAG: type II toxin-antitoxin system RelE/ParE family toxin [Cyclobacteriaceae bacterium]|nr:type II toxin-antitoxin system RelE/ParE family toxin [Cyclobacteriaceae bacterium]